MVKIFWPKEETIELDLTQLPNRAHVIFRLDGDQRKPSFVFVWRRNCYYCGKKFNCYRYPRKDRHHQCSKKCTDLARNRSPRRRKLVTVIKEEITPRGLSGHLIVTSKG